MSCCNDGPKCVPCPVIGSATRPPLAPGQIWFDPVTCSFKYLSNCSGKIESLSAKPGNGLVYNPETDRWDIDIAELSGLGFVGVDGKLTVNPGPGLRITSDNKLALTEEAAAAIAIANKVVSVKNLGDFSLTPTSVNDGIVFADTAPKGWNIGAGRMSFSANMKFNNYFTLNPNGHMAIVLRQDPALAIPGTQGGAVRGHGCAMGNLALAPEGTQVNPGIQAEVWAGAVNPQGMRLIPSTSAPTKLLEGVDYKILVESSVAHDGQQYVRYALYKVVPRGVDIVFDTGDVLSTMTGADLTKSALIMGQVFGAGVTGWSIDFTNAKVVWGPFGEKATDFSGVTEVLAARTRPSNGAFAVATAFKSLDIGTTRTWTTIKNNDNILNAEFGSWNTDGSVFTFNQAGSFQFDIFGVFGAFVSNAGQLRRVGAGVYADFGTFKAWVGGLSQLVETGDGISIGTGAAATIRIANVVAGQTFKLVAFTDPNPGFSSLLYGWGVSGGVKPESGTTQGNAVSGVAITRY